MRSRVALLILLPLAFAACSGTKVVTESVYDSPDGATMVELRRTTEGGEPVPQGYAHPATVSDVRLAHILAHFTYKDKRGRDWPVFKALQVFDLATGLNRGLQKAGPDDEIIARVFARERNLKLFTTEMVTALRMYSDGTYLVFEFYAIEQRVEKARRSYEERIYQVPKELPEEAIHDKRLVAGQGHSLWGKRGYQVDWRDPFYRKAVSFNDRTGQLRRRTILLEDESLDDAPEQEPVPSGGSPELRDAQLKALDELDAARRAGLVKEAEFQRRRRLILEGRLEEAGYGAP